MRQVECGHAGIAALEDDITQLSRKDDHDRRTCRLQKMRCRKCRVKINSQSIGADGRYVSCVKKQFNTLRSDFGMVRLA